MTLKDDIATINFNDIVNGFELCATLAVKSIDIDMREFIELVELINIAKLTQTLKVMVKSNVKDLQIFSKEEGKMILQGLYSDNKSLISMNVKSDTDASEN